MIDGCVYKYTYIIHIHSYTWKKKSEINEGKFNSKRSTAATLSSRWHKIFIQLAKIIKSTNPVDFSDCFVLSGCFIQNTTGVNELKT